MIRPATMVDRMKRNMEIPADFMAASSKRSPRLPYNMMEDSRVASGRTRGIILADAYNNSFPMTHHSSPLPTRSSIYFHRNWISRMSSAIKTSLQKAR